MVRGPFLAYNLPARRLWTPKIDSEGPDGSRCTKRELGSLSETQFPIIFVRSVKDFRNFAISILRNWLVRVCMSYQKTILIQVTGCTENRSSCGRLICFSTDAGHSIMSHDIDLLFKRYV